MEYTNQHIYEKHVLHGTNYKEKKNRENHFLAQTKTLKEIVESSK